MSVKENFPSRGQIKRAKERYRAYIEALSGLRQGGVPIEEITKKTGLSLEEAREWVERTCVKIRLPSGKEWERGLEVDEETGKVGVAGPEMTGEDLREAFKRGFRPTRIPPPRYDYRRDQGWYGDHLADRV